jgi:hypothetical protein
VKTTVKIEGLRELDASLGELPRATGKNVLRRVGRKNLQPFADDMQARAPELDGHLKRKIGVGTKLTRRQASLHRKIFKDDRASVELFAGAGGDPAAVQQEFGNNQHPPQPFGRPAYDAWKGTAVHKIAADLWTEIDKAAKRLARKTARLAAKG